ncbi:MAG: hypothetical protein D9V47_13740 [Clostridia bacterium]|nr:MAG: hypothetical protein D9V47_13740 [Clostridia bacterium]
MTELNIAPEVKISYPREPQQYVLVTESSAYPNPVLISIRGPRGTSMVLRLDEDRDTSASPPREQ